MKAMKKSLVAIALALMLALAGSMLIIQGNVKANAEANAADPSVVLAGPSYSTYDFGTDSLGLNIVAAGTYQFFFNDTGFNYYVSTNGGSYALVQAGTSATVQKNTVLRLKAVQGTSYEKIIMFTTEPELYVNGGLYSNATKEGIYYVYTQASALTWDNAGLLAATLLCQNPFVNKGITSGYNLSENGYYTVTLSYGTYHKYFYIRINKSYQPEPDPHRTVYFLSDSSDSFETEFYHNLFIFISEMVGCDFEIYSHMSEGMLPFLLMEGYYNGRFNNSFLIIEVNYASNLAPGIFLDVFRSLKEDGCQIMFICGIDEINFRDDNEFLDYVDIHINTDVFTPFMYSVFHFIEQRGGLRDSTFFVDQSIAAYDPTPNNWFYVFFTDYLVWKYKYDLSPDVQDKSNPEWRGMVLYECRVNLIFHIGGDSFVNMTTGRGFRLNAIDGMFDGPMYGLCTIWQEEEAFYESYELFISIYESCGYSEMPIFVYSFKGPLLTGLRPETLTAGMDWDEYHYWLELMVGTFVGGGDLSYFDNWPGRCVVTWKPFRDGEGGWIWSGYADGNIDDLWDFWMIFRDEDEVW